MRDGFATVAFTFDDDGQITDRLVLAASHPAFTATLLAAMQGWEIDATGLRPALRRESLRFNFVRQGSIVSLTQRDAAKSALNAYGDLVATSLATCREEELDTPLRALATPFPAFSSALRKEFRTGFATVSFVVDGEGRVRVPTIADSSAAEFGPATLEALRTWRFAPARSGGRIVQVIVERTLRFQLRAPDP